MFNTLSDRLGQVFRRLTGFGHLSESQIDESLREIRLVLIEADVALPVIKTFLEKVRVKAIGQEILSSLTPAQTLIRVVRDELVSVLGGESGDDEDGGSARSSELSFQMRPPAVMMLAGLQGSGKTTTAAKLAQWIQKNHQKSVFLVSTDVYRPAAREQLKVLGEQLDVPFFETDISDPLKIWAAAHAQALKKGFDVILLDTAGRLHIDETMMAEIKALHQVSDPIEVLFVADSMMGQDAAKVATEFARVLPLTGVILTKVDGDARGGAALSIRQLSGAPIKFIGVGEGTDALERFYADRMASRILGMGDVLSLIEDAEKKLDQKQAKKSAEKFKKGQFDLEDYLEQLLQVGNMGGIESILSKMPGMMGGAAGMMGQLKDRMDSKKVNHQIAIVRSMTRKERRFPALIKASQKKRIAAGSGTEVVAVNRLLKQFMDMQRMVVKISRQGGMKKMMRMMQTMMGGQQGGNNFPG